MRINTGWSRVTQENRCPICHKPDWCLVSEDGQACICARIESNKRAGDGGWLHRLDSNQSFHRSLQLLPKTLSVIQLPQASAQNKDKVYRSLLAELTLSDRHRDNLLARGLTLPQIKALGYASLPINNRPQIVSHLIAQGLKMGGVPGFYLHSGEVRLAGPAGMVIPVKDIYGWVVGLQVRCDNIEGGKYKWVSSAKKPYGCSSGSQVHLTRPGDINSREIWITEGPLKADIAALCLNQLFIAICGVANWHGVIPIIQRLRPSRVVLCFDMDKNQNPAVRLHLDSLIAYLVGHGFRTFEADWDQHCKGLDDLLVRPAND